MSLPPPSYAPPPVPNAIQLNYQEGSSSDQSATASSIESGASGGSINTLDALRLISEGVKLDHTDIFAPKPSPNQSFKDLAKKASFAIGDDEQIWVKDIRSASSGNMLTLENAGHDASKDEESPVSTDKKGHKMDFLEKLGHSEKHVAQHDTSKHDTTKQPRPSFLKRLSRLGSSTSLNSVEDYVINEDQKTQLNNPELLNSMKLKNQTVLNLQKAKQESKKELKKRLKEEKKLKKERKKNQGKELKEYYAKLDKLAENEKQEVPPAFLLDNTVAKFAVPANVLTHAEHKFPNTVKRNSFQVPNHEHGANPTPVTDLSKKSTKHYSMPPSVGQLTTPVGTLKRYTVATSGHNFEQNSQITQDLPNPVQTLPQNYVQPADRVLQEPVEFQSNDLYTLSEKSMENSINSRLTSPVMPSSYEMFDNEDGINQPVLTDYSSGEFYSADSGSEGNLQTIQDDMKNLQHLVIEKADKLEKLGKADSSAHCYTWLAREPSERSFNSTRVRVNLNINGTGSDSDF